MVARNGPQGRGRLKVTVPASSSATMADLTSSQVAASSSAVAPPAARPGRRQSAFLDAPGHVAGGIARDRLQQEPRVVGVALQQAALEGVGHVMRAPACRRRGR